MKTMHSDNDDSRGDGAHEAENAAPKDNKLEIQAKLELIQLEAKLLAEKERSLGEELKKAQEALAGLKESDEKTKAAAKANLPAPKNEEDEDEEEEDAEPVKKTVPTAKKEERNDDEDEKGEEVHEPAESEKKAQTPPAEAPRIQRGATSLKPAPSTVAQQVAAHKEGGKKIIIQLSNFGVPSIATDLSKPYNRVQYTDAESIKYLSTISNGVISGHLLETDLATANEVIAELELERSHHRVKFAEYIELPTQHIVGLPSDELERKLYMRHFRNKEAQHRVFMIGFSVAMVCVLGAVLADVMNESNAGIVTIATVVGIATTALGLTGHIVMRFNDTFNEKHAVRVIQELALLDNVIDKFRIALR